MLLGNRVEPDSTFIHILHPLIPDLARFLVPMFDAAAGIGGNLIRAFFLWVLCQCGP